MGAKKLNTVSHCQSLLPKGLLLVLASLSATYAAPAPPATLTHPNISPSLSLDPMIQRLGPGMNLGNCLEAPKEGEWGLTIQDDWFVQIKKLGFKHVRIPIRWSAHASATAPYTVDPALMQRVRHVVNQAKANGLHAVINMHHYDELFQDPDTHSPRFLGIWSQVAQEFQADSDSLLLEPLNEPNTNLTPSKWNTLLAQVTDTLRKYNPNKWIVVSPADWGGPAALAQLVVPKDPKMILTVHYYLPFAFTHQNAEWVTGSAAWAGTPWNGDWWDKNAVDADMRGIVQQAQRLGLPVWMGEFGAYSKAPLADRERWTAYVARRMESLGMAWAYWEWASGFGIYDPALKTVRTGLSQALMSTDTSNLVRGEMPKGQEMLVNGSFEEGMKAWTWGPWGGKGTGTVSSGVFGATLSDAGPNPWSIQLLQSGLQIQKGRQYALIFRARSAGLRSMDVGLQDSREATNWKVLGTAGVVSLDTNWTQFATAFYAADSSSAAQVVFNLGKDLKSVEIDDVQLLRLEGQLSPLESSPSGALRIKNHQVFWNQDQKAQGKVLWKDAAGRVLSQKSRDLNVGPQSWDLRESGIRGRILYATLMIDSQNMGTWMLPAQL
jgi:endoglucanase